MRPPMKSFLHPLLSHLLAGVIRVTIDTNGGLPNDYVYSLAPGPEGALWIGTDGGLARLDQNGRWLTYSTANTGGGLPNDNVYAALWGLLS